MCVRCGRARLTSIAISYAMRPASAFAGQSAARQLPSPAAVTKSTPSLQLDDRLPYLAGVELLAGARCQGLQRCGHRRQVLRVLAGQVLRGGDEQPVPGQHHRLAEVLDP